jgi:hypothetical protein
MDRNLSSPVDRGDDRRVHRIVVDVLARPDQVHALQDVIGTALCDAPLLHEGPCRVAWTLSYASEPDDDDEASYGLDRAAVADAYQHLLPIETWPPADVDASLGLR